MKDYIPEQLQKSKLCGLSSPLQLKAAGLALTCGDCFHRIFKCTINHNIFDTIICDGGFDFDLRANVGVVFHCSDASLKFAVATGTAIDIKYKLN